MKYRHRDKKLKTWPATALSLTGRTADDGRTDVGNQLISGP